jgi:hypothetical protein
MYLYVAFYACLEVHYKRYVQKGGGYVRLKTILSPLGEGGDGLMRLEIFNSESQVMFEKVGFLELAPGCTSRLRRKSKFLTKLTVYVQIK